MENKQFTHNQGPNQPIDVTKHRPKLNLSFLQSLKKTLWRKPPKKRLAVVAGTSVGFLVFGIISVFYLMPKPAEPNPEPVIVAKVIEEPPAVTTIASPLTGVQVEPAVAARAVTGVMIENSIDARPQAGLNEAGVVFEAIAEGGITRFLALFQEAQPEHIGPIRSARPYYVEWMAGFDAAYVHSGGSGEALALIRNLGVKDLDHGNYPATFDRVSNRYAPHNVYTSMARLDALKNEKGFTNSTFTGFTRVAPAIEETKKKPKAETEAAPVEPVGEPATSISFSISGAQYNTSYAYDAATKTYPRTLAGQPHTDERSSKQIAPSVVVALLTDYGFHPDGVHSQYKTIGSGDIIVFQNGQAIAGKWSKASAKDPLLFTAIDGTELPLAVGQTWITAIPKGRVSYTP